MSTEKYYNENTVKSKYYKIKSSSSRRDSWKEELFKKKKIESIGWSSLINSEKMSNINWILNDISWYFWYFL